MTGGGALASVAVVRRKRPDFPVSLWLAVMFVSGGAVTQTVLERLVDQEANATAIAWANLASLATAGVAAAAAVSAIGPYPSGRPETTRQRKVARAVWLLVVPPVVLAFATPEIPLEYYYVDAPELDDPLQFLPFSLPPELGAGAMGGLIAMVTAAILLISRYRRSGPAVRRSVRILLVPLVLMLVAALTTVVLQERGQVLTWSLLVVGLYSLGPSLASGVAAGFFIPPGFGATAVAGGPTELTIVGDPGSPIAVDVVQAIASRGDPEGRCSSPCRGQPEAQRRGARHRWLTNPRCRSRDGGEMLAAISLDLAAALTVGHPQDV